MSRKVIIKALLPTRDTISTMTVSPRLVRAELYICGLNEGMLQVSNLLKNPLFSVLCPVRVLIQARPIEMAPPVLMLG
jgi:hypothetical protein